MGRINGAEYGMNEHSLSVLIIGAGQIASGHDTQESISILTHSHAVSMHSKFNLLGFYDTNKHNATQAAAKWGVKAYDQPVHADVAVVCTPDDVHLDSVRQVASTSPKLIILEKPVARTLEDYCKICEISKKVPIQVNFSRRFVPEFTFLSVILKNYGVFLTGSGLYGKGFIHNGSHLIDLLELLVGKIDFVKKISETHDFYEDDPTKTVCIRFSQGEFFMVGVDCRNYTVFELDLCFEKARIRILNAGKTIEIFEPTPSEEYKGYVYLTQRRTLHPDLGKAMLNMYQNVYEHIACGAPLLSPLRTKVPTWFFTI